MALRPSAQTSVLSATGTRANVLWAIGCALALAQPGLGQVRGEDAWIDPGSRAYVRRFRELLLDASSRDLRAGWTLAKDLGRPVAPLLWRMFDSERSNVGRRLTLLVAAALAGGPAEDVRLLDLLDQPRPLLPERARVGLLGARGPERARPVERFVARATGPNREPEALLEVAVRLAAARVPEATERASTTMGDDVGLLAAAAFAGIPVQASARTRMWRGDARHAGLFQRAELLRAARDVTLVPASQELLEAAKGLLQDNDVRKGAERSAAMLLLAASGELDGEERPLDLGLLKVAASPRVSREQLARWLQARPSARDPEPATLAVAYALLAPIEDVVATRSEWARDPKVGAHASLALAARLCGQPRQQAIDVSLDSVPEWSFAVWASGGAFAPRAPFTDARLQALAALVADGRAAREAVQEELELRLWAWGSHPGLQAHRLERELVRDLMLVGSLPGGGKYAPQVPEHMRYFPRGLDRDDGFFELGVQLYELLGAPSEPIPARYRLQ